VEETPISNGPIELALREIWLGNSDFSLKGINSFLDNKPKTSKKKRDIGLKHGI
jgi:hypothetical protein